MNNDRVFNATVSSKNIYKSIFILKVSEATYLVISKDGQDHKPNFLVEVSVDDIGKTKGKGKSIKEAEIKAAKNFIDEFNIG